MHTPKMQPRSHEDTKNATYCFWSSDVRDHVDLDERVPGNAARGRDRGPHRRLGAEAALEHLVHALVVLQVVQVDVTLQDLLHGRSNARELLLDLIEDVFGVRLD